MSKITKVLLLVAIATMPIAIANAHSNLPELGNRSETYLTKQAEQQLGKEFMRQVRQTVTIIDDPLLNNYIQNLGIRLAAQTTSQTTANKQKFHFFTIADPSINAFAGPDGYIGINGGLILATRNESELAAAIAHEIAHVTQHHLARNIENARLSTLKTAAVLVAALAVGASSHSSSVTNAANGALMGTIAGNTQQMLNFSRENEAEADNIGIKILSAAGFDPQAMSSFFTQMQSLTYDYINSTNTPPYLLTHPLTEKRIATVKDRIKQYPQKSPLANNTYYLMHATMQVLTAETAQQAINYFKHPLPNNQYPEAATLYGYTLALLRNHQLVPAENNIRQLIKSHPQEVIYQVKLAQIQIASKNFPAAVTTTKNALATHPNYYPLILQHGQALIANKQFATARDFLKVQADNYRTNNCREFDTITIDELLATSYANAQDLVSAYQSKAHAAEASGYYNEAIVLLEQALKQPTINSNSRANIKIDINRLKKLIAINNIKS